MSKEIIEGDLWGSPCDIESLGELTLDINEEYLDIGVEEFPVVLALRKYDVINEYGDVAGHLYRGKDGGYRLDYEHEKFELVTLPFSSPIQALNYLRKKLKDAEAAV